MKIKEAYERYRLDLDPNFNTLFPNPDVVKNSELEIHIVVFTGGPCAGKTSAVNKVVRKAVTMPNFTLFVCQEAADHLKKSNLNYFICGEDLSFQIHIFSLQLELERSSVISAVKRKLEHPEEEVAVAQDRSLLDGMAYMSNPEDFEVILRNYNMTIEDAYNRSDMVIYLRSAAVGAEHAYTTSDGTLRDETIEEAAALDAKEYKIWSGHKNFVQIDNSFMFNEKLDIAISKFFSVAGIKIPVKNCRRFIIHAPNEFRLRSYTTQVESFWDRSFFLKMDPVYPDRYRSIRIRAGGKHVTYHLSEQCWGMAPNPNNKRRMTEIAISDTTFQISEGDVLKELLNVDPHISSIERLVHTFFVRDEFYCELSVFECNQDYGYLRVFFDCDDENVDDYVDTIMQIFQVIREVTFERKFCEYEIARSAGAVLSQI